MFAADSDLEIRLYAATTCRADAQQLAHAVAIAHLERIVLDDLALDIVRQTAARIVAAQAKRRLSEIVCAEPQEIGGRGEAVGRQRQARRPCQRAHEIPERQAA